MWNEIIFNIIDNVNDSFEQSQNSLPGTAQ